MTTVAEQFGYKSLHLGNSRLAKLKDKPNQFVCGCEFEIEDIKDDAAVHEMPITIDIDHSLRNKGKEYKTPPDTLDATLQMFEGLHKKLVLGKEPFTERTSIHVHVNVRELEIQQLRQFILTYALLEPLFFEYVGPARKNSIFCVPLNYTYLPSQYKLEPVKLREKWHKYAAFNIRPLAADKDGSPGLGTVEFRHLYGTGSMEVFSTWLTIIKELYTFIAESPTFNLLNELAKEPDVAELAHKVVPTLAKRFNTMVIRELLVDTLLDVKLSAGGIGK